MKPFTPPELEELNRDLGAEGMMLVGDKGKIVAGFLGQKPELLPKSKMDAYEGEKVLPKYEAERRSNTWIRAIKSGEESDGSFRYAGPLTETINLGAAALRAKKRIEYDEVTKRITNDESANQYLTREYRKGWEM